MSIRLYSNPELTAPISSGDMTSPDADIFDGSAGESRDRQLFLANEQSALAAAINDSQTGLALGLAVFRNGDLIIVDSEIMQVVSGAGTPTLVVQRGVLGTTPAAHAAGAIVYLAVDYEGITVTPEDTTGSDESGWVMLAATQEGLESAASGEALSIGSKAHDQTISFWRRYTVPAQTPPQNKADIKLAVTGFEHAVGT